MTYPQGYTPPPKPKPNLKPTQSSSLPLPSEEWKEWHDRTSMDDHLNDFEKERYTDTHFKKPKGLHLKKYAVDEPFIVGLPNKKHGFFKRLMLKIKIAEEVKK